MAVIVIWVLGSNFSPIKLLERIVSLPKIEIALSIDFAAIKAGLTVKSTLLSICQSVKHRPVAGDFS